MLELELKNLQGFVNGIDRWALDVEQEIADVANGLAVEAFNKLLETSPQYSGDFVGNWKYSVGQPDVSFERLDLTIPGPNANLFKTGSMPGIMHAKTVNKGKDKGYKLGDTFYISNSAEHGGQAYNLLIEQGQIKFRPGTGNVGHTMENVLLGLGAKYSEISRAQATRLKRKKL